LVNALNTTSFLFGDEPLIGGWYSDDPISLAHSAFFPNCMAELQDMPKYIIWLLLEQISLVVSGQAKQRVHMYLESND